MVDYGRFNSKYWGILFAYSDIFRDIVIPEWNKKYPSCELKYDVKLLDYAREHREDIKERAEKEQNNKNEVSYEENFEVLMENTLLRTRDVIKGNKHSKYYSKDYGKIMKAYKTGWRANWIVAYHPYGVAHFTLQPFFPSNNSLWILFSFMLTLQTSSIFGFLH